MLSRFRNTARVCRDAFIQFVRSPRAYRPAFPSEDEVFAALRDDLPALSSVRAAARSGALPKARGLLLAHLRERSAPRFFVDPAQIGRLVERFARGHPDWPEHALGVATGWQRYVYWDGQGAQTQQVDLPDWNHLPLGPGADTVQVHRAHHFAFATQLARAQAYGATTGATLRALVDSWLAATAESKETPAYLSPLMAVHRASAITWALVFLGASNARDADLEFSLLRILLADARFVHSRLGTSVANNHLLGDAFLMTYLGMLYPEFEEASAWRRDGEPLFWRELERQVYDDGTSFEHSVHYHEFVCEMVTAIVLLARRNGVTVAPWVLERHRRMLEFQAALSGPEACAMPIGDSVEHQLFPLDSFDGVGAASHREILRALYEPDFPGSSPRAPGLERAAWLMHGELAPAGPARRDGRPFEYPQGGFIVLPDAALDGCLILRTGPAPGLLCNPGHMHSDLLSVYLRLRGIPVIVEAGTYTYRSERERWPADEPAWRAHFLGPSAHNGLCIAQHDPLGRMPGDFPWGELKSRVVARRLASGAGLTWAEATVAGETPFSGHIRGAVHVEESYWLVYDLLPPSAIAEDAWLSLQFSSQTVLRQENQYSATALDAGAQLQITLSQRAQGLRPMKGVRAPAAGWVSPRYGALGPALALRMPTRGGPSVIAMLFEPVADSGRPTTLDIETTSSGAIGIRVARGETVDYVILPRDAPDQAASFFSITFRGRALWLRAERGRPVEFRAVEGCQVQSGPLGLSVDAELTARSSGWRWLAASS